MKDGEPQITTAARIASPDYFKLLGIPLIKGRSFTEADRPETRSKSPSLISRVVRHHWANEDPIGHRISFDEGKTWQQIVGVVGDTKELTLSQPADDEVYVPLDQLSAIRWPAGAHDGRSDERGARHSTKYLRR